MRVGQLFRQRLTGAGLPGPGAGRAGCTDRCLDFLRGDSYSARTADNWRSVLRAELTVDRALPYCPQAVPRARPGSAGVAGEGGLGAGGCEGGLACVVGAVAVTVTVCAVVRAAAVRVSVAVPSGAAVAAARASARGAGGGEGDGGGLPGGEPAEGHAHGHRRLLPCRCCRMGLAAGSGPRSGWACWRGLVSSAAAAVAPASSAASSSKTVAAWVG